MIQNISKSKENIPKQLKGFIRRCQFFEKLILAQDEEIKFLKKKISNTNHSLTEIDSKIDFICQKFKCDNF
jgi:hypothetical protein